MKLRHIHFPNLTPYTTASRIQDVYVSRLLAYKTSTGLSPTATNPAQPQPHLSPATAPPSPSPTILTFEFPPTYTAGLRSTNRLTSAEITHLRASDTANFSYAPRGGQTTFHGPGQLVAYPIIDLRRHALSARCYVNALERAAIETCGVYGVSARTTQDVGVWVRSGRDGVERKICAVGVHLRRHVSSHGIGLNVDTDLAWFERIVACGLEGKESTSLAKEGVGGVGVGQVGKVFVQQLAGRLSGVDEIECVEHTEKDYDLDVTNS